ncbi:MAG: NAD(P)H-hydrate epimerase [Planctomycetaceae bacterium]|nr:MAG: NAD(P)H-hydrate epimerase [Planctomycetaceae bacterium]
MSVKPLTCEQVRALDRAALEEYGLPGVVLMENAGRGCVEALQHRGWLAQDPHVHIICGRGNNAGDGFVIARHLDNRGIRVTVWLAESAQRLRGDAGIMFHVIERAGLPIRMLADLPAEEWPMVWQQMAQGHPWFLIDALLGTGLKGEVQPPLRQVIEVINQVRPRCVSVDIPSGLDADRGVPLGAALTAQLTLTMAAPKLGFLQPTAAEYTGEVEVIDIGIPRQLWQRYSR